MDILTQGALGAGLAACAARREELRAAATAGLAAGVLADADALIRSGSDPLITLELHRHFTHSLIAAPVLGLIAALLLWPVLRRRLRFGRLLLFTVLGASLSGVLDACTSYGTHLLWPFSAERVAWSVIAIVDPVFSLALILGLGTALARRSAVPARAGLLLATAYLGLGALQHQRAERALTAAAEARGHRPEALLVKPTLGNLVLWRGLYRQDGVVHADGVRVGLQVRIYPGDRAPLAPVPSRGDLARFATLSDGWVIADPWRPQRLGDARYAMLPTALRPLWGIEPRPGGGVRLYTERTMDANERRQLADMLLGRGH
jgi:inner membrane protein